MTAGFKRSRALWDNARRDHKSWGSKFGAMIQALSYELQPIRWSQVQGSFPNSQGMLSTAHYAAKKFPLRARSLWSVLQSQPRHRWLWLAASVLYYAAVRGIHSYLDAGPLVVIVTCLVGIFTIGLGDNRDDGLPSAYAVFNRGFQRLLGEVDADELLNQHVGGGAGAFMARHDDDIQNWHGGARANGAHQQRPPQRREAEANDRNHDNEPEEQPPPEQQRPPPRPRTGKKARRGNVEQRRELHRQRQAAQALGFGGNDDQEAMQQLQQDPVLQHPNEDQEQR